MNKIINKTILIFALVLTLGSTVNIANATIVRIETSLGSIDVNLYDETTPESVANFLEYITAGAYGNTLFHRSISGFILQGGGFLYNNSWPPISIQANVAVTNEPIYSNVRGTIAYAKLGGQPNSATNQWFFNLANNSANLDDQNEGFTVFGEVVNNGMDIIDAIVALNTYNLGSPYTDIPLQNYNTGIDPDDTNIILITSIEIIDASISTAATLNPAATTRTEPGSDTSSGGGSFGIVWLGMLLTISRLRKNRLPTVFKRIFK